MEILLLTFCIAGTIILGFLGYRSGKSDQQVKQHISKLMHSEDTRSKLLKKSGRVDGTFYDRILFPLAQTVFDKTQSLIPLSNKSWVKTKLIQAGYLKPHYPKIFLGIQLMTTAFLFGMFLFMTMVLGKVSGPITVILPIIFALMGYGLPMVWLMQESKKRQESIQKSLPDFLDLLVICVEAGLGLDIAINKLTSMRSVQTSMYLRDELIRYSKDVSLGKPRREALLDMANRTGVEDFNTIINALVQSYEMGTGVALTLRVQSESLRVKRLQKAEEKANKIPVKMVLPIYIFLFPAIFVSIFGPIAMIMIKSVFSIFAKMNLGS